MSLFRKPKKIQRRVFTADDDEDGDPEPPPPPIISEKKLQKEKKDKPAKSKQLLSFADEEEEVEEFKVKKSSQSKRLAKQREREKHKRDVKHDGDSNKFDNNALEEKNNMDDTIIDKKPAKKKVTLEGLILSGREALAANGAGDLSEEEDGQEREEDEEDSRGFHRYRAESVRAALATAAGIPDAALIHAARKTRQQARELGGDYIPVNDSSNSGPSSRLQRDDGSGDDEDEGRIHVRGLDLPSDKPKRTAAVSEEELDSEVDEWEEQQLQKARSALGDIVVPGEPIEVNPFSVCPPPAPLGPPAPPAHLRPLVAGDALAPTTATELLDALYKRVEELQIDRRKTASTKDDVQTRLLNAARVRESRSARCAQLDTAYKRAQAIRGYLTDLIECLDEKMPVLEALEARALALHRRRCELLVERRRADLSDQAQHVMAMARPGSKPVETEEQTRRAAEREGRRRARRLARGNHTAHRDGDSTDDELPPTELHQHQREQESIRTEAAAVFADALPAWRSVRGVCARLARWRRRAPALYADAYVPHYLPKLLAPYVRHQLILWNPLADDDNDDYEKMDWYKCLMMYGVSRERADSSGSSDSADESPPPLSERDVRDDPDLMLVPTIVAKVVLPKLTELVEASWDPLAVRACVRLRRWLTRASSLPRASTALRTLARAARRRLQHALAADVFLPTLPPSVMEGPGGQFWRRCVGSGARLVRAALSLASPPDCLAADPVVLQLIDTLCTGAGAAGGVHIALAASVLAETLPRCGPLRARALARVAALATLALHRLDSDNPLHLKALEQARTIIAEAKAAAEGAHT